MIAQLDALVRRAERLSPVVRWTAVVGWLVLIWSASSLPLRATPRFHPVVPNTAHVVAFGTLAGLWMLALRRWDWVGFGIGVAAATLYGAVDEWHQCYVPGRSPDPWDVVSDFGGAALVGASLVWLRSRTRWAGLLVLAAVAVAVAGVSGATWG